MSIFRVAVVCVVVSLSVSVLADSVASVGLFPVGEYNVSNWDGGVVPNTGTRLDGENRVATNYGPQVPGFRFGQGGPHEPYIDEELTGTPQYCVGADGRAYLSFEKLGFVACTSGQAKVSQFDISKGYTLVGFYRLTEDLYSPGGTGLGVSFKGYETSLLDIGGAQYSYVQTSNNWLSGQYSQKNDISDFVPDDNSWFQIAKVFNPAAPNPDMDNAMGYKVDYYINDQHVMSVWYTDAAGELVYNAGDSFIYLEEVLGDIGSCRQGSLGYDPKHQIEGLEYGYFAAYDYALSAAEVAKAAAFLGVPEPATMTLLALGGLALLRRRR